MNHKKSYLFLSLIVVLFTACTTTKNTANAGASSNDEAGTTNIAVTLDIEFTANYCGGANPPDELIQRLKTPKKLVNQEIYISKENKLNDGLMKSKTDANGKLVSNLEAGTYYLYLPEKISSEHTKGGDEKQCEEWKNKSNGEFQVSNGSTEVAVSVNKTCERCGAARM